MTNNCNRVNQEGRCDGAEWVQCAYCGAIDDEPCKDNQHKTVVTYDESGKALVETYDGDINHPADYSFATVNDFIHSHDRTFEELLALCWGMAVHIEKLERGGRVHLQKMRASRRMVTCLKDCRSFDLINKKV